MVLGLYLCLLQNLVAETRTIHILVALCDNDYQGIVPVTRELGNGQNPKSNLYWGAAYGIKTYFRKQKDWIFIEQSPSPSFHILERIVFKHSSKDAYIVADAYDGRFISETINDLFAFASGRQSTQLKLSQKTLPIGGGADHVIYVGHNGLMDFSLPKLSLSPERPQLNRFVSVFACKSRQYFSPYLRATGAEPGILTTQFMAPEAYSIHTLIDGWLNGENPLRIHQRVAETYSRYQRLRKPAHSLFAHTYEE